MGKPDREAAAARLLRIADRERAWMEEIGLPDASSIGAFLREVAEMLREQEPRVMTLEEVIRHYSLPPVFVDDLDAQEDYLQDITPLYFDFPVADSWAVHWRGYQSVSKYLDDWKASYGMTWRCWTARPTDEQREAAKWDG